MFDRWYSLPAFLGPFFVDFLGGTNGAARTNGKGIQGSSKDDDGIPSSPLVRKCISLETGSGAQ